MDASSSQFAWPFPGLLILVATMPVVLAAAGGRRHLVDHLPAPPPSVGTQDSRGVSSSDDTTKNMVLLVFSFFITLFVSCYIHYKFCSHEEEQGTSRDNGRGRQSNHGEVPRRRQQQRPAVAAAPPAVDVELAQAPVLVCTFRTADRWAETTCSECLSQMTDGEAVRVLTLCMHCFHATCVEQWLREHATCPLCRAPTGATAAKGRQHRPTT